VSSCLQRLPRCGAQRHSVPSVASPRRVNKQLHQLWLYSFFRPGETLLLVTERCRRVECTTRRLRVLLHCGDGAVRREGGSRRSRQEVKVAGGTDAIVVSCQPINCDYKRLIIDQPTVEFHVTSSDIRTGVLRRPVDGATRARSVGSGSISSCIGSSSSSS
jgi:hypothetical protein